jgi:hypothetical protein
MADARFLFLGVVANVLSVFSVFIVSPVSGSTDRGAAIALMSIPLIVSIALTMVGILKKAR